jgi:manganese peroxidase
MADPIILLCSSGANNSKEAASPILGEMRLQSDFAISRDNRTSCLWQGMVNNQYKMMTEFAAAMAKLQVLGQDTYKLTDCSEVVPTPAPLSGDIKYPPTFSQDDIEQAVRFFLTSLNLYNAPISQLIPTY